MMKGKVEKVEKEGKRRREEGRGMIKVHRGFLCI